LPETNPYRLWGEDGTTISGLACLFQLLCKFDGTPMALGLYKPTKFAINDGTNEKNSHAIDVTLICPKCGFKEMYGVAISKKHYDDLQEWIAGSPKKIIPGASSPSYIP